MRLVFLLLIPLGILTFHNLSGAGFAGDDFDQFVNNESIRNPAHPAAFFTGSTFYSGGGSEMSGTYYRPVMMTAFSLLYHLWGTSAFHLHIVLIGIGILNSILAFFFLRSVFDPFVALFGAAVFLLQPLNAEVVEYISNYQDALFLLFGLLALNIEAYRKSVHMAWFAGEFVLLMLAALSKETGLLFLPLVLLFNLLVLRQSQPQLASRRVVVTLGTVAYAYACLRIFVANVDVVQSHHAPMELAPFATRLLNMPAVVFYYLKNFFLPWPLGVAQHWVYREVTVEGFFLPLLGVAVFLAFAWRTIHRFSGTAVFFLSWWVIGIGLHVHILPLDSTVADRWHYLPSLGLIGLLLFWVQDGLRRPTVKPYIGALAVLVIIGFGLRTYIRNEDWLNEEKLLARDLAFQPESFAIMSQLGFIYTEQQRYAEACPLLEESVAIAPNWTVNTNNLGVCYYKVGRFRDAETYFRKSMDNGAYYLAHQNLATLLIAQQRYAEARRFLETAVKTFPQSPVLPGLLAATRKAPQ